MTRTQRPWSLTWRAATLAAFAASVLVLLVSTTTFVLVRESLRGTLQDALARDAAAVAALYQEGAAGSVRDQLSGPTGGVVVQLYDPLGDLWVASDERYARGALLPTEVVVAGRTGLVAWRGNLRERPVQVALQPFALGVVAVIGEAGTIDAALARLQQQLAWAAGVMVLLAALGGAALAREMVRPVRRLAQAAAALNPETLEALPVSATQDEVAQLSVALNNLLQRLREALAAQRQFLAETSHELRTPLTALQGFLARAARKVSGPQVPELEDAARVAAGMGRLVGDLLQLSRGEVVREVEPFLLDVAREVAQPTAAEFPGVTLSLAEGAWVVGDQARLRQLLRNLLSNAVRVAGAAGVAVRVEVDAAQVRVQVEDSGPGIPEADQVRVFEKFWSAGGGTGLGLAIARQIARAHGSDLALQSAPGRTVFTLLLPRVDVSDDAGA